MSVGSHTCLSAFDDEVRMTPLRRRALVTIALGEFVDGYDLIVISAALLQLQHHFHLGKGQVGLAACRSVLWLGHRGFLLWESHRSGRAPACVRR